ncbi:MAG TPA: hypothetical protein VFG24_00745 [Nitrosopumilaceae archaeon]|nr:hypothetical protein [Nitrosopumilaceae archaeon]
MTSLIMTRRAVGVTIGILAFVIAGAAVYGMLTLNETIQAKPNQGQVSNYSAEIGSLKPQINSISNNMSSLNNQGTTKILYVRITPPIISSSGIGYPFTAQTSYSIYSAGDQINVSGSGAPYTKVNSVLTSPSGLTYASTTTTSSDGSYLLSYFTSQSSERGYWTVNLTNQGQTRMVSIYVGESGSTSSGSSSMFTAQTDKTVYKQGDPIIISGTGKPYTAVKATLTSPSGTSYDTAVTAHLDGSYVLSYTTSHSYETGNWYITETNWSLTKVISIYLEPMG